MKAIDRASDFLGVVGAVLLLATGAFLTYEVVARYVFTAPTKWAQELSELSLLWGVFIALGRIVHRRENIAIDVVYERFGPARRRLIDGFALALTLVILVFIARYGFALAWESIERGTTTGTMLNYPSWWEELAVPVGCTWAAVQTALELYRVATGRVEAPRGIDADMARQA